MAYQQHALGNTGAKADELLRLAQELHDFLQLFFGLIAAGDVVKRDRRVVAAKHAGPALAKADRLVVAALRLAEDEVDEGNDDDCRQEDADQARASCPARSVSSLTTVTPPST
jgi:hypothetical protein